LGLRRGAVLLAEWFYFCEASAMSSPSPLSRSGDRETELNDGHWRAWRPHLNLLGKGRKGAYPWRESRRPLINI
jgi:hypothetical protein